MSKKKNKFLLENSSIDELYDVQVLDNFQNWVRIMWNNKKRLSLRDNYIMTSGLGGETGEVLEILKKAVRNKVNPDIEHLTEELGDVLYYVTMICNYHKISLVDVIGNNVVKINERYGTKK